MFKTATRTAFAALLFSSTTAIAGPTAEQKCEGGKNQAAGKYAACVAKAEKKLVLKGDLIKYGEALVQCEEKLTKFWDKLEMKATDAGTVCPSVGDQTEIQDFHDACEQSVAMALAGGTLGLDPVTCEADLGTCNDSLATCGSDLSTCEAEPSGQLSKTGRTACYDTAGSLIACAGTGHDGELQKGLDSSFTDHGDGTITDNLTGLMWEKQSDDNSIHDKDVTWTWGDAFTAKIATLNSTTFAGYNDWRLPNRKELDSLVNLGVVNPSTYSEFNNACVAACTVTTCSCTEPGIYWSSSTYENGKTLAWWVGFFVGESGGTGKATSRQVRAVRDAS